MYELYSPVVQKIEVIRLRKHSDPELYYLRDAVHEGQTYPQDMEVEILPEGMPVPLDESVIRLKPKPWTRNWELLQVRIEQLISNSECSSSAMRLSARTS